LKKSADYKSILSECRETAIKQKLFGLCDDQNQQPAFTDINMENQGSKWIAYVENENQLPIQFTPIDNCVKFRREDKSLESTCDGILEFFDSIIFVELKIQRSDWISHGIEQLENTISLFEKYELLTQYTRKMAHLCNKKHPYFPYSQKDTMTKFKTLTGVRLRIESHIKISA
jgi:hypothetical protein